MPKEKFLVAVIILVSALLIGVTALFILDRIELNATKQNFKAQQVNEKALTFTKLFVEKVLQGDEEVNFEDRLKLENAVRDLNDEEVFLQWQKIVKSQSAAETQQEVGTLLNLLLTKILY